MSVSIAEIEAARRTIAGQVLRTPMLPAPKLSALTGADVHVKYENLQVTNSFKERGAVNKLASLDGAARARRVAGLKGQVIGQLARENARGARSVPARRRGALSFYRTGPVGRTLATAVAPGGWRR